MKTWKLTTKYNGKVTDVLFSDNVKFLLVMAKHHKSLGHSCYLKYATFK